MGQDYIANVLDSPEHFVETTDKQAADEMCIRDSAYTPPLASAKPDLQEMGHKAAELVLAQLQGKTVCTKCHVLPCTIHVRPSVCSIGEA